jgi:hypothetical protein
VSNEDLITKQLSEIGIATKMTEYWSKQTCEKVSEVRGDLKGAAFNADLGGFFARIQALVLRIGILAVLAGQLFVGYRIMKCLEAKTEGAGMPAASAVDSRRSR